MTFGNVPDNDIGIKHKGQTLMLNWNTGLSRELIRKNLHFFSENMQYFETFCVYSIIEVIKKNCFLICK